MTLAKSFQQLDILSIIIIPEFIDKNLTDIN